MKTPPERIYINTSDPRPAHAAPAASTDEIEAFLAARGFRCELLSARITLEQCEANRSNGLFMCGKCTQERPGAPAPVKRRGRPPKRHKGDNPDSPWRQNPGMLPKDYRHGIACPATALGEARTGVEAEEPAKPKQASKKASKQASKNSPSRPAQLQQQAVRLEFTGADAGILTRFAEISRQDGHDPAADVATILDLFMTGRLRLAKR
jgi:hypothetical protein